MDEYTNGEEDLEAFVIEKMVLFNSQNEYVSNDLDVLYRVVCSAMKVIEENGLQNKLKLFRSFPEGTIFTRTCKGVNGCGTELRKTTTFTNITTLGNLMIKNPKLVNDSVIFLKSTRPVQFLDFNIISQIFGVQLKSGVPPSEVVGDIYSRGIFSVCCPIPDMQKFCLQMGVMGIIQVDAADAYYFNEDQPWFPENLRQGTGARMIANGLVLDAIKNKCAYPIFGPVDANQAFIGSNMHLNNGGIDSRLKGTGALFPEFNFHVSDNLANYLEYCDIKDPIFTGPLQHIIHSGKPLPNNQYIPYFILNEIFNFENSTKAYLNFQKDMYQFPQLFDWQWVQNVRYGNGIIENGVLEVNRSIIARQTKINNIFKNRFIALPYLCDPGSYFNAKGYQITIINIEYSIAQLIFDPNTKIDICGKKVGVKTIYGNDVKAGGKEIRKRRKINLKKSRKNKRRAKKGCSFIGVGAYKYQQQLSRKTNKRQRNKTNKTNKKQKCRN